MSNLSQFFGSGGVPGLQVSRAAVIAGALPLSNTTGTINAGKGDKSCLKITETSLILYNNAGSTVWSLTPPDFDNLPDFDCSGIAGYGHYIASSNILHVLLFGATAASVMYASVNTLTGAITKPTTTPTTLTNGPAATSGWRGGRVKYALSGNTLTILSTLTTDKIFAIEVDITTGAITEKATNVIPAGYVASTITSSSITLFPDSTGATTDILLLSVTTDISSLEYAVSIGEYVVRGDVSGGGFTGTPRHYDPATFYDQLDIYLAHLNLPYKAWRI